MAERMLLLQAAATLAMVGLIWFIQVVHYPLFGQVGRDKFPAFVCDPPLRNGSEITSSVPSPPRGEGRVRGIEDTVVIFEPILRL